MMSEAADEWDALADLAWTGLPAWAAALAYIRTKEGQLAPFQFNEPQIRLDAMIEQQFADTGRVRMLVPKARQLGVSTYTAARFYRRTVRQPGQNTYILTHEDRATQGLFNIAQAIHDGMAPELRLPASSDAANSLAFRSIRSSYGLATARTKASGRSMTVQNFHGSESAFWPNADSHLSGIMQAIGGNGTEAILESTGNGPAGPFYDLCMQALAGKGEWQICFLPWFEMGTYRQEPPEGWSPPSGWLPYAQNHRLDNRQAYWAYQKNMTLAIEAKGDPDDGPSWSFMREYPATLDEVFVQPGQRGLVDPEAIATARAADDYEDVRSPLIIGVDSARGGADSTWIIDRRGRDAGVYINQKIDTADEMVLAGVLVKVIKIYKPKAMFIDITGPGYGTYCRLVEMGYDTVVRGINFGSKSQEPDRYINKRVEMWVRMREWIESPLGCSIPDDDELIAHVLAPMADFDSLSRWRLEKKEDMKKRLGYSPDGGDALALTFAEPIAADEAPHIADAVAKQLKGYHRRSQSPWAL